MSSAIVTIIIFVVAAIIKGAAKEAGNPNQRRPAPPRTQPQRYYTNSPQSQNKNADNYSGGGGLYKDNIESFFDDPDYKDLEGEELDKRYPGSLRYEDDPEGKFAGNLAFSSKEGLNSTDEGEAQNAYGISNEGYGVREEDGFSVTLDDLQKSVVMAEILGRPRALRKYGRQ